MKTVDKLDDISDEEFLSQIDDLTLHPAHFSHMGHLRLAWLLLNQNDTDTAAKLIGSKIKAYAESMGATRKFNLTLTDAFVRIMANRIAGRNIKNLPEFLEANPDLVENAFPVLRKYFSQDLLLSEKARTTLIKPDLRPL